MTKISVYKTHRRKAVQTNKLPFIRYEFLDNIFVGRRDSWAVHRWPWDTDILGQEETIPTIRSRRKRRNAKTRHLLHESTPTDDRPRNHRGQKSRPRPLPRRLRRLRPPKFRLQNPRIEGEKNKGDGGGKSINFRSATPNFTEKLGLFLP